MQDKEHINQGDLSVDRAWEEMLKLLDQEMPVEAAPRRRVLVGWWWMAAACLLGAGFTAAWFYSGEKLPAQQGVWAADVSKEQTASTPNTDIAPTFCLEANQPTVLEGAGRNKVSHVRKAQKNVLFSPGELPGNAFNTTSNKPLVADIKNELVRVEPSIEEASTIKEAVVNPRDLEVFNSLATLDANVQFTGKEAPLPVSVAKQHLYPPLSIHAAGLSANAQFVDGFSAGLETAYSLSPKFSIEPGVGYRFQRQGLEVNYEEPDNVIADEFNLSDELSFSSQETQVGSNGGPIGQQEAAISYPVVLKTHILDATLAVSWHFANRWQLALGPQFSYLAAVYEGVPTSGSGINFDTASNGGVYTRNSANYDSWYKSSSTEQLDKTNFRRLDVGICAGLSFKVSKHFGIRAQYRQGLVDRLKSKDYNLYNQYMSLGAVWRL